MNPFLKTTLYRLPSLSPLETGPTVNNLAYDKTEHSCKRSSLHAGLPSKGSRFRILLNYAAAAGVQHLAVKMRRSL
jgi:hypothetical protein